MSTPPTTPPPMAKEMGSTARLLAALRAAAIFVLVAVLFGVGCLVSREFLTPENLLNMLKAVTLLGIVVTGVTFTAYSGHYVDLSIPGIMALAGIVTIGLLPLGIGVALVGGVVAGVAVGAINGWVIAYLRVNPIIGTLAMMSMLDGAIRWWFGGKQTYPDATTAAGDAFVRLFAMKVGPLPLDLVTLGVMGVIGWWVMARTAFGAKLKLIGSSYEAAVMTGIRVRRLVMAAFVLSALAASVAGIFLTSLNKVGASYIGTGYDFLAITAAVIGGVTLAGGRGGIWSAIGGVLVIGLLQNIMTLAGMGNFEQTIVRGGVFIAVVGLQAYALRRGGRDDA